MKAPRVHAARAHARTFAVVVIALGALASSSAHAQQGGGAIHGMVHFDELEVEVNGPSHPISWNMKSWVGGDWNRVWLKSEGEVPLNELAFEGEAQLLYSRLILPNFELQAGLRGDLLIEPDGTHGRGLLAAGLYGHLPYWFELDFAAFVSHRGHVSARLHVSHNLYLTQRLIAESSVELNAAVQRVPDFGLGAGLNDLKLGLRVRYEIVREFAPYLGLTYRLRVGETGDFAEAAGERRSEGRLVAGVRFWY